MKKNPVGREWYFNDGVYEMAYKTEAAAWKAAQKLADAIGKAVRVHVRGPGTANRTGRTVPRMRKNPAAKKLTLQELKHEAKLMGYSVRKSDGEYRVNKTGASEAEAYYTDDIQDAFDTIFADAKYRGMRKNPASYGRSVMATRYRALPSSQEIARMIFGARAKAKAEVRKLPAAKAAKVSQDGPYTVYWKDARGEKSTEAGNRKEADSIAKALKAIQVKGVRVA